ncbi:uncharacterized protein LOC115209932 isoform X3 [Octopus sinensis]|uniref:Uncharacterized protein LOC115209932 isoform X3 n=1 Tax=Octopus sinensis TaxID=2607531 RepID=A0A6P7S890_9MOLL|nr:uncharacterized protein LOC115209932 isoform X3 [Octopus sinensis]
MASNSLGDSQPEAQDPKACVSPNRMNGVELIDLDESLRTQNIIKSAVKILKDYCRTQHTTLSLLEKKPAQQLSRFLQKFYTEVRQVSGKLYARKSMITLRYGLQRHFKRMSHLDIITDDEFIEANEVFSVILMKLRAMGKDAIKRKNPITEEDIQKIMLSSALDQDKPRGLQNKVFMDLMLHMCSRGRDNLREISKRDFSIELSPQGLQYVTFRVGAELNSNGDPPVNEVRMYEIPGNKWCPLTSFKKYINLLNPLCDAFWQRSKQNVNPDEVPWYDNMPIGKNTLGTRMKEISREAGCSQIYTNHCLRTTQISTLRIYNMDLPQQSGISYLLQAGPSNQVYSGKPENPRRKKIAAATVSSAPVLIPDDSPPQPSPAKIQKKQIDDRRFDEQRFQEQRFQERRFENRRFDDRRQMVNTQVSQMAAKTLQAQMPVQQHMSVAQVSQNITRPVQVLAPPIQISEPKPKPVEKPRPREKRIFVVADHQRCVMSNLASLWKSGKLCDAGIGNGSSTVMVHKVVLSAVCPKLLSVFSTDILSHKFLQVNFPEEVSTEALNAFAEYMYNGLLDIDPDILHQLKIIAKRLDMKEFEQLCDSRLPSTIPHQPASTVTVFGDLSQMQTILSNPPSITVPTVQPSLPSSSITSVSSHSTPSVTTQVIDVKQEISEAELAQVKKDTAAVFGQESEVASLDASKSGNSSGGFVIVPSVKTEPVGPEDDRYGQLNNQSYTSTPVSISSRIPGTGLNSTVVSSSEFVLPFSDTTDSNTTNVLQGTSKLKSNVFESSLVSDLSPVSCIVEKMCSQSSPIREDPSKPLNRTITTQSIDNIVTSGSNEGVYPVGLFTAGGDSLPLSSSQVTSVKNIGLYKTDGLT